MPKHNPTDTPVDPAVAVRQALEHHKAGRLATAEQLYQRVLAAEPGNPQALHFMGLLAQQQGKRAAAVDLLRRSVEARPDSADFLSNYAIALGQMNRTQEALEVLARAVELDPSHAEAHSNRGVALEKLGRQDDAVAAFREAVRIKPQYAEARHNLGALLMRQGKAEEAMPHLQEAVRLAPRHAESRNTLGNALRKRGKSDDAVAAFRKAVDLRPNFPEAYSNLGSALNECGRLEEAVVALRKAIELRPDYGDAHWNLALALLAGGDFDRGWMEYEWRQHLKEDYGQRRNFPQPAWNGSPVSGKTVLLLTEQGMGDTIQFVRYAALLAKRGAKVVLECQPPLRPILASVAGVDRVVARGEPLPVFDLHARLMSLPGAFGTTLATIPAEVPYLHAEPERAAEWKQRVDAMAAGRFKVGIAWQGSKGYGGDHLRSIPLEQFAPLAACPNVALFSLQKGPGTEQIPTARERFEVLEFNPPLDETSGSFVETAAVMENLDLVISSDTSLVHLAGALGVPVWVALPFVSDWRWLTVREDSPWYPTMRLLRQGKPGDWPGVFQRIAAALSEKCAPPATAGDAPPSAARVPSVTVPVAPGELIDKITILEIKSERIEDPDKRRHVDAELSSLRAVRRDALPPVDRLEALAAELKAVNETLWQVEDGLRACERSGDFGPRFVDLARSVYRNNDRRCAIKREVNELLGSQIVEEKSYERYEGAPASSTVAAEQAQPNSRVAVEPEFGEDDDVVNL